MRLRLTSAALILVGLAGGLTRDLDGRHPIAYGVAYRAARGDLHARFVRFGRVVRRMPALSAETRVSALEAYRSENGQASAGPGIPAVSLGCSNRTSLGSVRVNQDCTVQRQAEEDIVSNPRNPLNLIAGQNDSSIGWNHCGYDYSIDGGKHWGSGIPPFYERLNHPVRKHTIKGGRGSGHTYDAASDPSVAFDSQGNAFFSCILFDVKGNASGLLVGRSPETAQGSFYNVVPAPPDRGKDKAHYVVVEDDNPGASVDKELIAADSFTSSPYRDSVYVTWTEFVNSPRCSNGQQCYTSIYFSRSRNHGVTWSKPREISGNSSTLCFGGNLFDPSRRAHDCDFDQGSQPVVLPNGHIVVVFNNDNTSSRNPNQQQLAVISRNGGKSWSRPVLVGRDVTVREPNCNFSDGADQCVPGSYVRVDDFPRAGVDRSDGHLYVVWNDYRDRRYDVRMSVSTSGGKTWKELPTSVEPLHQDGYMASVGISPLSHDVAVGFYGSNRVFAEAKHKGLFKFGTGGVGARSSRFYLAVSRGGVSPFKISTLSPWFQPPNGEQSGFNGDYTGVTVVGNVAHPIWSDTRNSFVTPKGTFNDEDVFTTTRQLP